jgi:glycosyltransferase involved in cell wall biosynthesis
LKIHHIIDNLEVGGAETLVVALSKEFIRSGHEVVVHGLFGGGPLVKVLQQQGVSVIIHPVRHKLHAMLRLGLYFLKARPDVVHCHNVTPTVVAGPGAALARIRSVVSTRHGSSSHRAQREQKFWLAARCCHKVIAVSEAARQSFLEDKWAIPNKLVTIYNGAARPNTAASDDLPDNSGFVLISVGRLVKEKDYPSLLQAVAQARSTMRDLQLWIVGDGGERQKLEALISELHIQDCVRLPGMQQNVGFWLSRADVFVLSSVFEGLPVALLESMAMGLPAIVTDVGGMPDVVRSCGSGLVVPRSNPAALANAIVELASARQKMAAFGEGAQRCYKERFTIEQMAAGYLGMYRQT